MLSVEEAKHKILESCSDSTPQEEVYLHNALNRVLAQEYHSPIHVPPEDNSAMDGYALNSTDLTSESTILAVSQRIPAGASPNALQPGTAARIFTGGILPKNADAVVMQENCEQLDDHTVKVIKSVRPRENVRPFGQDIALGALLFKPGHCLRPQDIALIASVGIARVSVFKRPVVGLLGTGNELIEPGNALKSGQIYNSNKFMLAGMLQQLGCEVLLPQETAVEDSLQATIDALQGLSGKADLILSTGGVSVGEEDYIKPAMEALGTIENWKIKLKPGKPLVFGNIASTAVVGLPGNPVSAFVTFLLFVAPLLRKLQGLNKLHLTPEEVPMGFSIDKARQRPEFLRVVMENGEVNKFNNQSSGVLSSTVWADALAMIPEETILKKGDSVKIYPLNKLASQALR